MTFDQAYSQILSEFNLNILPQSVQFMIALAPIALAFFLFIVFADLWIQYVRAKFFLSLKYAILEIRLPRDIFKSPLAMEVFLQALHNTSDGSTYAQYWKGETRPWYSLEMTSVEGQVKFYIWTEDRRKGGVISALYSQFPGIEVREVDDYSRSVQFDPGTMQVWGAEFEFTKPDPYPIKTYIDYGLDKDPKEELKVDPLTPFLEFLGSVGPNQQVWLQLLVRAHVKSDVKPGHLFKKTDKWRDEAEAEINKIMLRDPKTKVTGTKDKETDLTAKPTLSPGEQVIIEAIGRSITKQPFDVGVRAVYIAQKDFFNRPFAIGGIIGGMKHFTTEHLNGFKPAKKWHGKISDPWQDYKKARWNKYSYGILAAYRRRSYFYPPYEGKPLVMNSEELATMYHFPGQVAGTPTLERVPSKKAQAPTNLPI